MTKGYAWLKGALMDRGLDQKDVAKEWGVDDAVVSRFITTGAPKLTWGRAQSLSRLLSMSLDELNTRIGENIPPKRAKTAPEKPSGGRRPDAGSGDDVKTALDDLNRARDRARVLLPDAQIDVTIKYRD